MKPRWYLVALGLLGVLLPGLAGAASVHYFACANCHKPGMSVNSLASSICLSCHFGETSTQLATASLNLNPPLDTRVGVSSPPTDGKIDGKTKGVLLVGDASHAFGHGTGAPGSRQSSHNWAAADNQPAAGAVPPNGTLYPGFYTRYGSSRDMVTCTRCHDAHAEISPANPKMLISGSDGQPLAAETLCRACHEGWANANDHGWLSHPLVGDYSNAVGAKSGYKPAQTVVDAAAQAVANGGSAVNLISYQGKTGLGCLSCHGAHYVDSDAGTSDGAGKLQSGGDGKLLRGDGATRADTSALCQSCHTYQSHGGAGEDVGCLVCHSGHSYDAQKPNYYVLRKTATTATYNTVTGLEYSNPLVVNAADKYKYWNDGEDGSANGYCEKCHGDAKDIGLGKGTYHVKTAVCTDCHKHGQTTGAFAASCNTCHGFPPVDGSTFGGPSGLVATPGKTNSGTAGAHLVHAQTKGYPCGSCHYNSVGSGPTHISPAPQTVTLGFSLFSGTYVGGIYNGQGGVAYDSSQANTTVTSSGAKTCANTYCHGSTMPTNGGTNTTPTWDNPTTATCGKCHGASTTSPPQLGSHRTHAGVDIWYHPPGGSPNYIYSRRYPCATCHNTTASAHVDGKAEWVFDTATKPWLAGASYKGTTSGASTTVPGTYGQCTNVYCHSIVQTSTGGPLTGLPGEYKNPTWGNLDEGTCGSCHLADQHHPYLAHRGTFGNYFPAIDSGSHTRHLQHLSGSNPVGTDVCASCHNYMRNNDLGYCGSTCHYKPEDTLHVNHRVDVIFPLSLYGASASYDGTPEPGDGYGKCSNISCHGFGTPQWGGTVACGDCHAATAGTLTTGSHAGHLTKLNGPDGVVGSTLDCDGCHGSGAKLGTHTGHVNGVTTFADGNALAATNVCNTCHSPAGSYDGVNDAVVGAKTNWRTGIYTDGNLIAGKERWCVTCHDESPANSKADGTGVSARNMVGNNSTWGFYQTGHGADISVGCVQCHSTRMPHIDHIYTPILDVMKTTQNPNNYRFYVGKGMRMPYDRSSAPESRELCISCHSEATVFKQSGLPADATSNFRSDYADGTGYQNLHFGYHREGSNCITCHDPHGTSAPRMTADDRIGRFRLITLNAGDGKYYELSDRALWNSAANNHGGASTGSATGCGTCHSYVTLSAGASEPTWGMYQRLLVPISFQTVTDLDTDGLPDTNDNCPAVSNAGQADTDGDGVGDACDNSPGGFDPSNRDRDYDGIGDVSDSCPDDPNNDVDADGVCVGAGYMAPKIGGNDNCPVNYNPTQADTDGDGHPDACDNCPLDANADQSDYDLDGIGDACDASCDSFRNVWSQFLYPPTGAFSGLALDASDNVYGAGYVRVTALPGLTYVGGYSDLAILKYDKNGNLLAKAEFGSPDDGWEGLEDIAVDKANGFVYATGYTTGSLPGHTNLGSSDMVLAKYDADLNQIWAKQIATAAYDHGYALAIDTSGNLYVGAKISSQCALVKYNPDGTELWNKPLGGSEITSVAVDGAYVYAGGVQAGNAFVRQFGLDGTVGWSSQQGTAGTEAATSIVVTGSNVFVSGTTFGSFPGFTLEGTQDIFVLKLNKTDGSLMAATQFNAPDLQNARGIDTDSTENELYVTGSSWNGGQYDAFLLSFDTNLNVLRRRQLADTLSNTNEGIAVSKLDGSIYMAGTRNNNSNFSLMKEQKGCP